MRVFRAVQLILHVANSWTQVYQTGMYIRLKEDELGGNISIPGDMTLEYAADNQQFGLKREVINGKSYITREYIFATATSSYYSDYNLELWADNAPEGTIFVDTSNNELPRGTYLEHNTWKLHTENHDTSLNSNGFEYYGVAKMCVPVDTVPNSGEIKVNCGAFIMQYEIYLAKNDVNYEQSYIIADPSKGSLNANATLQWGGPQTEQGSLQVLKTSTGGLPLSGARFTLTGTDGSSRTGVTDDNGIILWEQLDPKVTYTLTETEAPAGYSIVDPINIQIQAARTNYVTVQDSTQKQLTLKKVDKQTGYSLQGAVICFEQIDGSFKTMGTTDQAGIIQFDAEQLPVGSYKVYEVTPPVGYELDPTPQTVHWDGKRDVVITMNNVRTLTVQKFVTDTTRPIQGVTFLITDSSGQVIGPNNGEYTTDRNGRIVLSGLTPGTTITAKETNGDRFSIKQLERSRKQIEQKLDRLNDQSRKDDLVTFEELGVDKLFIDEAHYYKNLAAFTKMRNVGGISQTEAQKSSDLYMKIRYLDELTGGRGVCFATGTPISNTMVEMFTMQKYLQYSTLKENDLIHFDSWASTFGETVTAIELAPEGTGYRAKTRFSRFFNLPELLVMFKEVADIQTADMLNLPVPKANYHSVVLKPSEYQKEMVDGLAERAEKVRNGMVNSSEDNMLVITNDGRKLALDQRLINPMLPDSDTGKVAACVQNVFEIWQRTSEQRSTQMVFCDLSTPHNDGQFNVYDAIRDKLIERGIPAEEIAYIHSAGTEAKKKELFGKVRNGQIRVLIGSTQKMGAGTNVQKKLIALHHLDCPWRPADLQQREDRIVRQGNENPEVEIFTYVTEGTFDAYLYQLVESKQKFIGQIMTSKSPVRSAEDIDETALSYAEIKALCSGNPKIKLKMDLDVAVSKLKLLKANHLSQIYSLESAITHRYPKQIKEAEEMIEGYRQDIERRDQNTHPNEDGFSPMVVEGKTFTEKKAAGSAILEACKAMTSPDAVPLGQYRGFDLGLYFEKLSKEYRMTISGSVRLTISLGMDIFGNIQRIDNALDSMETRMLDKENERDRAMKQLETAKVEAQRPFPQEDELKEKQAQLDELNIELNMDKPDNAVIDDERNDDETPERDTKERDR